MQLIRLTLESSSMPVILVKGTGGAADLLYKACLLYDEFSDNLGSIAAELSQEIEKAFLNFNDDSRVILKELLQCVKGKKNVSITTYDIFKDSKDFEDLILFFEYSLVLILVCLLYTSPSPRDRG